MDLLGAVVPAQRRRVEHVTQRALGVPAPEHLAHLRRDARGGVGVRRRREGAREEGVEGEVDRRLRVEDVDVDGAVVYLRHGFRSLLMGCVRCIRCRAVWAVGGFSLVIRARELVV